MNRKGAKTQSRRKEPIFILNLLQNSQIVILSTATPPGGAYSWNDSNHKNPVILSERSELRVPRSSVRRCRNGDDLTLGGPFDYAASEAAPLRVTGCVSS